MKVENIEIVSGEPDFGFTPIRQLEVKCEATNALMPAPTIAEANDRLRALAAKVGANAIVNVEYKSGVSFTSWKSLKATGLAGTRLSDERTCPFCAETIKRAAVKCRHCGSEVEAEKEVAKPVSSALPDAEVPELPVAVQEPLRDNNNPALIIGLVIFGLFIFSMLVAAAQ